MSCRLVCCLVPCRAATCAISWAMTPASSDSESAFSMRPELTKKNPPGRAKALTSSESSTLMVNGTRSEEHTSELQSHLNLVCRLLLEKKKKNADKHIVHQ